MLPDVSLCRGVGVFARKNSLKISTCVLIIMRLSIKTARSTIILRHHFNSWNCSRITCAINTSCYRTVCKGRCDITVNFTQTSTTIKITNRTSCKFRSHISGFSQREFHVFDEYTCNVGFIVRHGKKLVIKLGGDSPVITTVILFIFSFQPIVPGTISFGGRLNTFTWQINHVVSISRCMTAIRVATVAGTEKFVKSTSFGCGFYCLAFVHVAKFRPTTELLNIASFNNGGEIAFYNMT